MTSQPTLGQCVMQHRLPETASSVLTSQDLDLPPFFRGGRSTVFNSKSLFLGKPWNCFFIIHLLARTILRLLGCPKYRIKCIRRPVSLHSQGITPRLVLLTLSLTPSTFLKCLPCVYRCAKLSRCNVSISPSNFPVK